MKLIAPLNADEFLFAQIRNFLGGVLENQVMDRGMMKMLSVKSLEDVMREYETKGTEYYYVLVYELHRVLYVMERANQLAKRDRDINDISIA
jgi:hypothetical protein